MAATPFIGILLDKTRMATLLTFLSVLITIVGIVGSIPSLTAGYVNITLFVLLRPLYYSAVSSVSPSSSFVASANDHIETMQAKFSALQPLDECKTESHVSRCPTANARLSYGCIIALSGLVNLSQPLIDEANHLIFDNNPIPINVVMALLGFVIGTSLVYFIWSQDRQANASEQVECVHKKRPSTIMEKEEEELEA